MNRIKRLLPVLFLSLVVTTLAHSTPPDTTWSWENQNTGIWNSSFYVKQTSDGGYIATGYYGNVGPNCRFYLVRLNAMGDSVWSKTFAGCDTYAHVAYGVLPVTGGYIVSGFGRPAGASGIRYYVVKTDTSGDSLWAKYYGSGPNTSGGPLVQARDGGYLIPGYYCNGAGYWGSLLKISSAGDSSWFKLYGKQPTGLKIWDNCIADIDSTQDGNYVMGGWSNGFSSGLHYGFYLVKVNASGDTLWQRVYYADPDSDARCTGVRRTSDGGFVMVGDAVVDDSERVYVLKVNSVGDTVWSRLFPRMFIAAGETDVSVCATPDGGCIFTRQARPLSGVQNDLYVTRLKENGDSLWTKRMVNGGGRYGGQNIGIALTADTGVVVATNHQKEPEDISRFYVLKLASDGFHPPSGVGEGKDQHEGPVDSGFKIDPNPFTSFVTIPGHASEPFALYDVSGQKVGTYKGNRIGGDLRPGVYFVKALEMKAGVVRIVMIR